jgi:hypothetical protein
MLNFGMINMNAVHASRRTAVLSLFATALLALAACSHMADTRDPTPVKDAPRAQLSIGYSMLYQEADGIPKLKWILMFKQKNDDMARVADDLIRYYRELAATLRRLSEQYPGMRIDVSPMSEIEGDTRKAIGEDLAKDLAPVIGKSGIAFEREALLTFYEGLNEQRHLAAVMAGLEPDAGLKRFLETTKSQLDQHYAQVGALLNRRYFTH